MDLSIIIVNWNSIAYLEKCLDSIYRYTRGLSFEVIVVDNASPNGDGDRLDAIMANGKLIKSSTNLGFAGANNEGFKQASGSYLLFLNPDTELVDSSLKTMLSRIVDLPDAGIVGCKLLNTDRTIQTSCIQSFPTILNQVLDSDYLRRRWPGSKLWGTAPLYSENSTPAKVEVISGACMLVRRDVFEDIGTFSEEYFMYSEDLDLCFKAMKSGYHNYYLNEAHIIHHGGKSSDPEKANVMKWKAIVRFCEKHRGRVYGRMFRISMGLTAIGRIAVVAVARTLAGSDAARQSLGKTSRKWKAILRTLYNGPSHNISATS